MSGSTVGLLAGLLVALAAITGGLGGFLLAIVLGGVGYAAAGHLTGQFDLGELAARSRNRV